MINTPLTMDTDMLTANVNTAARLSTAQKARAAKMSPDKIDATAQEFEAQFISQMMGSMFATVEDNGVLSGGEAEQTYKSFLNNEYGKIIARAGGIGVSDSVKREMIRLQEVGAR